MTRPTLAIETGAYLGIGTSYLAAAVRDNGKGHVVTCELDPDRAWKAKEFLTFHRLNEHVSVNTCTGEAMIRALDDATVGFAFLDSALTVRVRELQLLLPKLTANAIVAIHDTNTYHAQSGGPRTGVDFLARHEGLHFIQFDTPRGLTLLRNTLKTSLVPKAY